MKFQKYIYILLIFLFCMISISAVGAAEDVANGIISTNANDNLILEEAISDDVSITNEDNALFSEKTEELVDSNDREALKDGETSTGSFSDLNTAINGNAYNEIALTCNYTFTDEDDDAPYKSGINIDRTVTIDGQGHTINGSGKAHIFNIAGSVTLKNIIFVEGHSNFGGAIYGNCNITNCTFKNNRAIYLGGAIYGDYTIDKSKFTNNTADESGGAIYGDLLKISDSEFTGNEAWCGSVDIIEKGGGAIYSHQNATISNCSFIRNYLHYGEGELKKGGGAIHFEAYGSVDSCVFLSNTADGHGSAIWCSQSTESDGIQIAVADNIFIDNKCPFNDVICGYKDVEDGIININRPYGGTNNWFGNNATNFNETPTLNESIICDSWLFLNATASPDEIPKGKTSDIAFKLFIYNNKTKEISDYNPDILAEIYLTVNASRGNLNSNTVKLGDSIKFTATEMGTATVNATLGYDEEYVDEETGSTVTNRITFVEQSIELKVTKESVELDVSDKSITLVIGDKSEIKYTLSPSDAAGKISFTSSAPKIVSVDSETGEITALAAGSATITINFSGNDIYKASKATVEVTVKKATPSITAKAKTFKIKDKTKKYKITLKNNKGTAMKNKKVTLKVNGKTYTAKTNSKGVATFKLSKLTKKGKYTAVITFAGNKNYNKATKKAKITVKSAKKTSWKTVARGSKDKTTVKKIQRALKKNGYYLSYKGRYLKVDGIYHKYTEMGVKQFQKAKGLKVTGKVDYKTAKKLKIVS